MVHYSVDSQFVFSKYSAIRVILEFIWKLRLGGKKMKNVKGIKIMLVDDEPHILQFLELGLVNEGYDVKIAPDGMSAINLANEFQPHVVVLDVMMPGMDGFEVCRLLKKDADNISIIMLTAKDEVEDRVKGLTLGADDYLVKPFSFEELLARIGARLRNQFPSLTGEAIGPFRIDDRRKEINYLDQVLELSPTEYELLKFLVINHGIVMSKSRILDKVWGYDFGGEENIVEVYIRSLREKLEDKEHRLIRTLRGAGYRVDFS
jgi:two-component system OmpR family response regulator